MDFVAVWYQIILFIYSIKTSICFTALTMQYQQKGTSSHQGVNSFIFTYFLESIISHFAPESKSSKLKISNAEVIFGTFPFEMNDDVRGPCDFWNKKEESAQKLQAEISLHSKRNWSNEWCFQAKTIRMKRELRKQRLLFRQKQCLNLFKERKKKRTK